MLRLLLSTCFFLFCCKSELSTAITLLSPDDRIRVDLELGQGYPTYRVSVDGKLLIKPSSLGFCFRKQPDLTGPFRLVQTTQDALEETWEPVWGQEKLIYSHSNMVSLELKEINPPKRTLILYFRAFDDGVGFRYEIPEQEGLDSLFILEELSEFNFAQNGQAWWIPGTHEFDTYEKLYNKSLLSEIDSANTPLTYLNDDHIYVSIHEANLTNYAAMVLKNTNPGQMNFKSELVPWPDGDKVKTETPLVSPWRTITIGRSGADLLKSRMILNLNDPVGLSDISWIKPMKYIGIWWGMHIGEYTWIQGDIHGATTANTKAYIDFAAANEIQGVLVEGWNTGWEKWGQEGALQLTMPYDDFDIETVTQYAHENGVAFIGHHETTANVAAYEEQLDAAFAYYEKLGVHAVKTGYVGPIKPVGQYHYGQWMVNHFRRVIQTAAKYHISLDVHEPIKPTGIERTWPNMMTREGARGQEYNAWSEGNPPDHTTILPFTRLLAGPMDYTPGIFDLRFDRYKPDNKVHSTLAKQLALMVVLYSPLQMAADLPENYLDQPAFQFIRDLETDWDETRYLEAEIGQFVTIARRYQDEWFVGSITNEVGRSLSLAMSSIVNSDRVAECYSDRADSDWDKNPTAIHIGSYLAKPSDTLHASLAPGGGLAIYFRQVEGSDHLLAPISKLYSDQMTQN
ncbi:MAG: glycoside hydrolase family 97 protein [Candidatus Marinimicrobia bacterium]|nr:glycoside hydrolase family 97 protein [Candidatus Neomarinimicrobiota bacterium]